MKMIRTNQKEKQSNLTQEDKKAEWQSSIQMFTVSCKKLKKTQGNSISYKNIEHLNNSKSNKKQKTVAYAKSLCMKTVSVSMRDNSKATMNQKIKSLWMSLTKGNKINYL